MKSYRITVDTGTTNTRAGLWCEGVRVQQQYAEVGVRCTAVDGNNARLCEAVRACLQGLLEQQGIGWDAVECVLASGMITANVGLCEVPHLTAPIGLDDLAHGMRRVLLQEICPVPFYFVPGMKNCADAVTTENFISMDIMRGEEAEAMALLAALPKGRPYVLVLPGSHTKFVAADAQGRLLCCLTTLTGELLSVLTKQTILADAVERSFVSEESYDADTVRLGFGTAQQTGLARAAFSTRILHQFGGYTPARAANYLLGVVLQQDLQALQSSTLLQEASNGAVVVAGNGILSKAFLALLQGEDDDFAVLGYTPEEGKPLSAQGMFAVYERYCCHQKPFSL